ncbi:MAG: hypothetical protein ABSG37_08470 [Candidatus Limnocylindrales bacterium]|jgi:hypothetical protein
MGIYRRLVFLTRIVRAAMPRLNAVIPSLMPLAIAVVGLAGAAVVSSLTDGTSPWPFWIGLVGVAGGILDAAYLEWNRWAPYDPPKVNLSLRGSLSALDLIVENHDVPAYFRLSVVDARCAPDDVGEGLPWLMLWDTGNTERHIMRGEQGRITLVRIDRAAAKSTMEGHTLEPAFEFPSVGHPGYVLGVSLPPDRPSQDVYIGADGKPLGVTAPSQPPQVQLTFSLFRVNPPTRGIERSLVVRFPYGDAEGEWAQSSTSPAISSQDQT